MEGVGFSDHWSFWEHGYDAIMVTDTAFFRNPHYHMPTDRLETLDLDALTRVTSGLAHVVRELAGEPPAGAKPDEPKKATPKKATPKKAKKEAGKKG